MAEWSKVLSLTASYLSPLTHPDSNPGWACEKVAGDLGLGACFHQLLPSPPALTTDFSRIIPNMAEKVMIIQIPTTKSTSKPHPQFLF